MNNIKKYVAIFFTYCFLLIGCSDTNKENTISTDQINHTKYRNEVFLPFVQSTRENYLQRDGWQDGDDVDDEHTWVSWMVSENTMMMRK